MIQVRNKEGRIYNFETTIFPDGTSQVWKMKPLPFKPVEYLEILWMFENESELFHVLQLIELIVAETCVWPSLNMPYFPYARQDKPLDNMSTFARNTFIRLLEYANLDFVKTYDVHSNIQCEDLTIKNEDPIAFIAYAIEKSKANVIVFPDAGAEGRYSDMIPEHMPRVVIQKKRDQQTGALLSFHLDDYGNKFLKENSGSRMLIVDDIADGGGTFIGAADLLLGYGPENLALAVSHGLFSKGKDVLYNAGINEIYTTNSLLRNPNGFKIVKY